MNRPWTRGIDTERAPEETPAPTWGPGRGAWATTPPSTVTKIMNCVQIVFIGRQRVFPSQERPWTPEFVVSRCATGTLAEGEKAVGRDFQAADKPSPAIPFDCYRVCSL